MLTQFGQEHKVKNSDTYLTINFISIDNIFYPQIIVQPHSFKLTEKMALSWVKNSHSEAFSHAPRVALGNEEQSK